MGYLALYRKYRPTDFDNVFGQDEIVTVLNNAIVNNKISHAYLFSGPRGTGKTTTAKIIARMVNCEHIDSSGNPCGKCYNCINFLNSNDIVEIDAASNNGVDEIRNLRDKVNLVPSNSKYKVYIIDEVHMLTNQAFNALLKTLEEPPSHVIFILATTEPHKIPLTISSRCQKFQFSKIDDKKIVDRLKIIAEKESITVTEDALYEIARIADGGMRDAINLLDQLSSYSNSNVSLDDIYRVNGSVSYNDIYLLFNAIKTNDKIRIIELFDSFDKSGKEIGKFIEELIVFLKDVLVYKNVNSIGSIGDKNENIVKTSELFNSEDIYSLIGVLNDVENKIKFSTHSIIVLMTSILKFSDKFGDEGNLITKESENKSSKIISREIICDKKMEDDNKNNDENTDNESTVVGIDVDARINNALALASKEVLKDIRSKWSSLDDYMYDEQYAMVCGLLKDSTPVVASDKYVMICNGFSSVVDRINSNVELIEKLFGKIFEYNALIVGISDEDWLKEKKKYIENIKNGVKYIVKEEQKKKVNSNSDKTDVDELIDLVGDIVIEYK